MEKEERERHVAKRATEKWILRHANRVAVGEEERILGIVKQARFLILEIKRRGNVVKRP